MSAQTEFWGAHAARVHVSAAGRDASQDLFMRSARLLCTNIFGEPPKIARQRRALPNPS